MSDNCCVFLRGINVNGIKVRMDALRGAFTALSHPEAKTVLASGNVLIRCAESGRAALKSAIEEGLGRTFGYDAHVFLRDADELRSVLTASSSAGPPPGCHLYYLICDSGDALFELDRLFGTLPHEAGESYVPLESGAFWTVPAGRTLESAFGSKVLGSKKFRSLLTSRNIGTIEKILDAMNAPTDILP